MKYGGVKSDEFTTDDANQAVRRPKAGAQFEKMKQEGMGARAGGAALAGGALSLATSLGMSAYQRGGVKSLTEDDVKDGLEQAAVGAISLGISSSGSFSGGQNA